MSSGARVWSTVGGVRGEARDQLGHTVVHSRAGVHTLVNVPRATEALDSTEVMTACEGHFTKAWMHRGGATP